MIFSDLMPPVMARALSPMAFLNGLRIAKAAHAAMMKLDCTFAAMVLDDLGYSSKSYNMPIIPDGRLMTPYSCLLLNGSGAGNN